MRDDETIKNDKLVFFLLSQFILYAMGFTDTVIHVI